MPSLNRNEKVTCEIFGVQITKPNLARQKKSCSAGTFYCTQCPNFFTKSRDDSLCRGTYLITLSGITSKHERND